MIHKLRQSHCFLHSVKCMHIIHKDLDSSNTLSRSDDGKAPKDHSKYLPQTSEVIYSSFEDKSLANIIFFIIQVHAIGTVSGYFNNNWILVVVEHSNNLVYRNTIKSKTDSLKAKLDLPLSIYYYASCLHQNNKIILIQGQESSSKPEIDIEIVQSGDHTSGVHVTNGNANAGQ